MTSTRRHLLDLEARLVALSERWLAAAAEEEEAQLAGDHDRAARLRQFIDETIDAACALRGEIAETVPQSLDGVAAHVRQLLFSGVCGTTGHEAAMAHAALIGLSRLTGADQLAHDRLEPAARAEIASARGSS